MEQYIVTGMSCAACSARVEKAVSAVEGVTSCSVSLLTNSMGVEGTASQSRIIEAVQQAGYGASPKGASDKGESAGNIQALVANGTLKVGDIVLAGTSWGRVKAMFNERNANIKSAAPAEPAIILGLNGAPTAGDQIGRAHV